MVSHTLYCQTSYITSVSYNPRRNLLASGSYDGTVRIYNLKSEERLEFLRNTYGKIIVTFSPDGKQLAIGSTNGNIFIWDLDSGKKQLLESQAGRVCCLVYNPDVERKQLAWASNNGGVWLYDFDTKEKHVIGDHLDSIVSMAFNYTGRELACASSNGKLQVWDIKKEEVINRFVVVPHINLCGANFQLAVVSDKDKQFLQMAGAFV